MEHREMVSGHSDRRAQFFPALLFFSGYCGISYEVLYARFLGNIVGDQFMVVASVLLTFLLGIGLGTLVAHTLWRFLWAIEAAVGLYAVWSLAQRFAEEAGECDRAEAEFSGAVKADPALRKYDALIVECRTRAKRS